jgi:2-isopropylmalate synthase
MNDTTREAALIYDWNLLDQEGAWTTRPFTFWDETLRDGLQSPSITDPDIEVKLRILHLQDALGVHSSDVGLPGAGPRAVSDVTRLVEEIGRAKLKVKPACAARTHLSDIRPIVEVSHKTGVPIEVAAFIGSSPVRLLAEDWDLDRMLRMTAEAVSFAVKEGLPVLYVTEDTVRSRPDTLAALFRAAIDHGATRLCLCDTVGHATPEGAAQLVRFTRGLLRAWGAEHIGVDWHGHNDRGLGLINNLAALRAGADRIHGTMLGVGERVGNASLDQTLVNLRLLGVWGHSLEALPEYAGLVSEHYGVPIPCRTPSWGATPSARRRASTRRPSSRPRRRATWPWPI